MRKLAVIVFLILFSVLILGGCSKLMVIPAITSQIEYYMVSMSSVPGFPIDVDLEIIGKKPGKIKIELETDKGVFLEWDSDSKIHNKGKRIEYKGETVYWSPSALEVSLSSDNKISVRVSYMGTFGKVFVKTTRKIYLNEKGLYSFSKKR